MDYDDMRVRPCEFVPYARYLSETNPFRLSVLLKTTSEFDSPELAEFLLGSPSHARTRFGAGVSGGLLPEVRTRLVQLLSVGTLNRLVLPKGSLYSKFLVLEHPEVASLLSGSARKHLVLNQDMRIRYRVAANPSFSRDERVEALCGYRSRGGPAERLVAAMPRSVDLTSGTVWDWESLLPFSDGELDRLVTSASPTVLMVVFDSLWDLRSEFCHPRLVDLFCRFLLSCEDLPVKLRSRRFMEVKEALLGEGRPFRHLILSGSDQSRHDANSELWEPLLTSFHYSNTEKRVSHVVEDFRNRCNRFGWSDPLVVDWEDAWRTRVNRMTARAHEVSLWAEPLLELVETKPGLMDLPGVQSSVRAGFSTLLVNAEFGEDLLTTAVKLGSFLTPPVTEADVVKLPLNDSRSYGWMSEEGRYLVMIKIAAMLGCEELLWAEVPARVLVGFLSHIDPDVWAGWCREHVPADKLDEFYATAVGSDVPVGDVAETLLERTGRKVT